MSCFTTQQGYAIHSNFVIESPEGEVLGYCRLEGFERSIQAAAEHNFTFVDLDGNDVARAERPFHWENGATEHVWNVSITKPGPPGSIGDTRAIITTVVHLMLLDEQTDFCQDIVFTITPVIITMTYCAPLCRHPYPCVCACLKLHTCTKIITSMYLGLGHHGICGLPDWRD